MGNTVTISAVLKNIQGEVLANKPLNIIFEGSIIETIITDADGRVPLTRTFANSGSYVFLFTFDGDEDYEGSNHTLNINVPKEKTNITGTVEGVVAVGSTITINAILTSIQGDVLAYKTVSIIFDNDIIETKTTDANGRVSFTHAFATSGDHIFLLTFDGDDNYEGSNYIHHIEVPRVLEPDVDHIIDEGPMIPEDIDHINNHTPAVIDSDELSENSKANAAMKNTGNPMVLLAICLLLAIIVPSLRYRKRK